MQPDEVVWTLIPKFPYYYYIFSYSSNLIIPDKETLRAGKKEKEIYGKKEKDFHKENWSLVHQNRN